MSDFISGMEAQKSGTARCAEGDLQMDDLISRTDLLRQIKKDSEGRRGSYGDEWEFIGTISRMPSVDAISVRCKDCKHWDGVDTCDVIDAPMWDNDFCSMGEKKDE